MSSTSLIVCDILTYSLPQCMETSSNLYGSYFGTLTFTNNIFFSTWIFCSFTPLNAYKHLQEFQCSLLQLLPCRFPQYCLKVSFKAFKLISSKAKTKLFDKKYQIGIRNFFMPTILCSIMCQFADINLPPEFIIWQSLDLESWYVCNDLSWPIGKSRKVFMTFSGKRQGGKE